MVTHLFALAIAIAISVLPALYAWVNIYANGNPYVNTGNIKIAIASRDEGIDLEDGEHVNKAEEVTDSLRDSTSIGWQFLDDADEAIGGVEAGDYYAAIIFEDNFTYNMYHLESGLSEDNASVTYYENQKKNAIAPKITDTAAKNVLEKINTAYIKVLVGQFFGDASDLMDELQDEQIAEETIARLRSLRDTLRAYDKALDSFSASSSKATKALASAEDQLEKDRNSNNIALTKAEKNLAAAKASLEQVQKDVETRTDAIQKVIDDIDQKIAKLQSAEGQEDTQQLVDDAVADTNTVISDLTALREYADALKDSDVSGADTMGTAIDLMIIDAEHLTEVLEDSTINLDEVAETVGMLRSINETSLEPSVKAMINRMESTLKMVKPLVKTVRGMLDDVDPIMVAANGTISSLDLALYQLQKVMHSAADKLDDAIAAIEEAEGDERIQMLIDILGGDSDRYASFLSSLVDVEVEQVYQVASYGAAMAPFYSVLAIWVGGVILVSILKTKVNRDKFPDATEAENYFGRLLIFLLLGQVQAAVIVSGDIFLLGCAPVEPGRMYLAAALTSLVFITFIYSLTLTFGDVGKAIVVVVMVVQIAGSSGSYPIEILPVIFSKMYRFFPFPYAINAMREALCGSYGNDYWMYLIELGTFLILGIVIGLVVRRRFIGMNSFVNEKLEETEVL